MLRLEPFFSLEKDVFPKIPREHLLVPPRQAPRSFEASSGSTFLNFKGSSLSIIGKFNHETIIITYFGYHEENRTSFFATYDVTSGTLKGFYKQRAVSMIGCSLNLQGTLIAFTYKTSKGNSSGSNELYESCVAEVNDAGLCYRMTAEHVSGPTIESQWLHFLPLRGNGSHLLIYIYNQQADLFAIYTQKKGNVQSITAHPHFKNKLAEQLCWFQWDESRSMIYILNIKRKSAEKSQYYTLRCIEFPDRKPVASFKATLEMHLVLSGYRARDNIRVIRFGSPSDNAYCLCQQHANPIGNVIRVSVWIFHHEIKFDIDIPFVPPPLNFNNPQQQGPYFEYSQEYMSQVKVFFDALGDLLVIYVPGVYLQLVDCAVDHEPTVNLVLSGPSFNTPLPDNDPSWPPIVDNLDIKSDTKSSRSLSLLDRVRGLLYGYKLNQNTIVTAASTPDSNLHKQLLALALLHVQDEDTAESIILNLLRKNPGLVSAEIMKHYLLGTPFREYRKKPEIVHKKIACLLPILPPAITSSSMINHKKSGGIPIAGSTATSNNNSSTSSSLSSSITTNSSLTNSSTTMNVPKSSPTLSIPVPSSTSSASLSSSYSSGSYLTTSSYGSLSTSFSQFVHPMPQESVAKSVPGRPPSPFQQQQLQQQQLQQQNSLNTSNNSLNAGNNSLNASNNSGSAFNVSPASGSLSDSPSSSSGSISLGSSWHQPEVTSDWAGYTLVQKQWPDKSGPIQLPALVFLNTRSPGSDRKSIVQAKLWSAGKDPNDPNWQIEYLSGGSGPNLRARETGTLSTLVRLFHDDASSSKEWHYLFQSIDGGWYRARLSTCVDPVIGPGFSSSGAPVVSVASGPGLTTSSTPKRPPRINLVQLDWSAPATYDYIPQQNVFKKLIGAMGRIFGAADEQSTSTEKTTEDDYFDPRRLNIIGAYARHIFENVSGSNKPTKTEIFEWASHYRALQAAAVVKLYNFILDCAGDMPQHLLFQVYSNFYEALEEMLLPIPKQFFTKYTVAGYFCLPRHIFIQYAENGLFHITQQFVNQIDTTTPQDLSFKHFMLGYLPKKEAIEILKTMVDGGSYVVEDTISQEADVTVDVDLEEVNEEDFLPLGAYLQALKKKKQLDEPSIKLVCDVTSKQFKKAAATPLSGKIRPHGNTGYRVKNLRGTSGCPHYKGLQASNDSNTKCSVNGCAKPANRACHVISANQNASSGLRKIVYMCSTHKATYGPLNIRLNALTYDLSDCHCGEE